MGTELTKAPKPAVARPRRVLAPADVPARTAPPPEPMSNALAADDRTSLLGIAREAVAHASAPLPHLDRIQASFGDHDLSGVRAIIGGVASEVASQVGAEAYTVGDRVAFRSEPDLRLAAHEAAHVVHQRAGVMLDDGVGRPGDRYEQHADAVADAVVAGRSATELLGRATDTAATPALQMECACGTCTSCVGKPWQPAVQFGGMGELRVAEARMEKEAEENAGKPLGLTRDQLEAKFYELARRYSDYAFWRQSGPRDLGEWMTANPGRIDDYDGPFEFNMYVARSSEYLLHPVPLVQMINPSLMAQRYSAFEHQTLLLDLNMTNYVTRAHMFWAQHVLSQGYLRFSWSSYSTGATQPSIRPDLVSEWRAFFNLGTKGNHSATVRMHVGGSSTAAYAMTISLDKSIEVVNREEFKSDFIQKSVSETDAEGNEAMFTRDADGNYWRKPGATPYSLDQQITVNLIKLGALKAYRDAGKITDAEYTKARDYFEERNKVLQAITLPSTDLYLIAGAFVSDEYPDAVQIRAVMANNFRDGGDTIRVVLKDTTLDPKVPTTHEGSSTRPKTYESAAWVEAERRAIYDMAEHWRLNNDYPHGNVYLKIGSKADSGTTFTATIPQQNWKKTLRTVLAPIALVGAMGAMMFGQVYIAVPLMVVAGAATLASVALNIEHRIQMGTFAWDKELLLDVLTVVSTLMGLGALSQAFRSFSVAGKVFYLVGMAGLDVAQGVLIAAEAKEQIAEARILYHAKLSLATTEEERQRLHEEFRMQVTEILGGAIVSGAFIAVSVAGGVRGIRDMHTTPKVQADGSPMPPHFDAPDAHADFDAWAARLDPDTQAALAKDPKLRKAYQDMDPEVRRALTLCKSPCIPDPPPSAADVARIKGVMTKHGIPDDDFRLREYLHRNRPPKTTKAVDELEKVKNAAELTALYDRSIIANAKKGTAAKRPDGTWEFTTDTGTVVKEHTVATHGELTENQGTSGFFQSHHGIQDKWAKDLGLDHPSYGYSRDGCPAILLRDSHAGSPHQRVTAAQNGSARASTRSNRTYADERVNLKADMIRADVPDTVATALLAQSDDYFSKIYRNVETAMVLKGHTPADIDASLAKFFGTWKPGAP